MNGKERTEMATCPKCGKVLKIEDYDTRYDQDIEDTIMVILCSSCGYDEYAEMETEAEAEYLAFKNFAREV